MPARPQPRRRRLHPDLTWPAPYDWVTDEVQLEAVTDLAPVRTPEGEVRLRNSRVEVSVTGEAGGALRLRLSPLAGEAYSVADVVLDADRSVRPMSTVAQEGLITFRTETASLALSYPVLSLCLRDSDGRELLRSTAVEIGEDGPDGPVVRLALGNDPTASIFGLGGRTAPPDRQGGTADMFATKGYHLRGDYGGLPVPAFLQLGAEASYGLVLVNPQPHVYFDFGSRDPEILELHVPGGPVDLILAPVADPRAWVGLLHELTGRPPLPRPQWLGTWFSYAGYATSEDYREWVARFAAEQIALDVWTFDLHWRAGKIFEEDEGGDGVNLGWDPEKFASHRTLLGELADLDVDSVLHVNTRMYSGELAEEGRARGYLRDAAESQWVADLEDPASQEWAWGPYAERLAEGVTAWWIDNSERVEGRLASGAPARNLYSALWNRFLTQRTASATGEPVLTLTRGGWLGDQVAALPWSGDTTAGVSRLREDVNFVLNLAMTGFPFSSVDLGGFKEQKPSGLGVIDTDENVIRRIAHGFLIFPVPRLHSGLLTQPKLPWRYEGTAGALLREFIELRHRLAPYVFAAAIAAVEQAIPLARPLAFDHPDDLRARTVDDELLFGSALLVAPVMDEGWMERRVYLPRGRWFSYWTGEELEGGRDHVVDAPLTRREGLPVFVREGGMLVTRPHSRPRDGFTSPTIAVYADASSHDVAAEELVLGSPVGSRMRIRRSAIVDGLLELELELSAVGDEVWTVDVTLPLAAGAAGGAGLDGVPAVLRGGESRRLRIDLRGGLRTNPREVGE